MFKLGYKKFLLVGGAVCLVGNAENKLFLVKIKIIYLIKLIYFLSIFRVAWVLRFNTPSAVYYTLIL